MKFDDKNYIPGIEDFVLGQVYKQKDVHETWLNFVVTDDVLLMKNFHHALTNIVAELKRSDVFNAEILIPYLTKEDFEELEFALQEKEKGSDIEVYKKFNAVINYNEEKKHAQIIFEDDIAGPITVFQGTLLNKAELKKILEQVGVIQTPRRLKKLGKND
jgi:hypothetical protein